MATKHSTTPPPPGLSAADVERLDTWMPEIADKILGHLHVEAKGSFRVGEKRNLVIHPGGSFHLRRLSGSEYRSLRSALIAPRGASAVLQAFPRSAQRDRNPARGLPALIKIRE